MVKVIDSEVVIKAYFKKYQDRSDLKYVELKHIRYSAEPKINAYIDVTYPSLRRVQIMHQDAIRMDNVKITLIGESIRQITEFERNDVELISRYL